MMMMMMIIPVIILYIPYHTMVVVVMPWLRGFQMLTSWVFCLWVCIRLCLVCLHVCVFVFWVLWSCLQCERVCAADRLGLLSLQHLVCHPSPYSAYYRAQGIRNIEGDIGHYLLEKVYSNFSARKSWKEAVDHLLYFQKLILLLF